MFKKNQRTSAAARVPCLISIALLLFLSIATAGAGASPVILFNFFGGGAKPNMKSSTTSEPLNSTPQSLPFSQNWSNTGLITTNDDWSGVPGIEGYFIANGSSTTTAVDPQTILGDTFAGGGAPELDVIANLTATTSTAGGVGEFYTTSQSGEAGTDPVVGFQGSATADAPFLLISVITTGRSNITVAYNLRDIDCTTDNAIQPVALHYRVGNSGTYTNLPTGFVADATTGPSECSLVTPVNVSLPANADNQPVVQIRIMTTNAVSSDEWVGVDDIVFSSATPNCLTVSSLTGSQEVPPAGSAATGTGTTWLSNDETTLFVDLNFSGLGSNATAAHIHGPASAGTNADVLFGLTGLPSATSGSIPTQSFALTPTQLQQYKDGLFYFNIHSVNFPGGEIRGQIFPSCGPAVVQFSSANFAGNESDSAKITLTRAGDTSGTSTVTFSTVAGGTATGGASCALGVDYITNSQSVTFTSGETSKTVNVTLCPDLFAESTETVNLALTGPSAGTTLGSQNTAVLSISDAASQNRNPAPITVNSGSPANLYPSTINVTGAPTSVFRIRVTLYDFLATPGNHVDVLLVGPNEAKYVLMGHVGSSVSQTSPVTLTFHDGAENVLPTASPLTSGIFLPTNYDFANDFASPAPAGPYVDPGFDVERTTAETLFANFSQQDGNGVWSLYVRDDEESGSVAVATIMGGWGIELLSVTSADATVSGRVITQEGSGLRGAKVTMVDSLGRAKTVTTSSLGYYQFDEIETGGTYIIAVSSKRFRFSPRVVQVNDSLTDVDFVGIE